MHGACTRGLYFHFRSKLWRHPRVTRPRFPSRCANCGDSGIIRPWMSVLRNFYCACAKQPYFHFRSKIWRHHRVPGPRFPLRRENFGDLAINKRYIAYFSLRMRETAVLPKNVKRRLRRFTFFGITTSGLKSDVTIVFLDPDFLLDARISAIRVRRTFKADLILLLNICMGFQDLLS